MIGIFTSQIKISCSTIQLYFDAKTKSIVFLQMVIMFGVKREMYVMVVSQ